MKCRALTWHFQSPPGCASARSFVSPTSLMPIGNWVGAMNLTEPQSFRIIGRLTSATASVAGATMKRSITPAAPECLRQQRRPPHCRPGQSCRWNCLHVSPPEKSGAFRPKIRSLRISREVSRGPGLLAGAVADARTFGLRPLAGQW